MREAFDQGTLDALFPPGFRKRVSATRKGNDRQLEARLGGY